MKRRTELVLSLFIILLGFAVRVRYLAHDSFWLDEIATVEVAREGLRAVNSERDHPPLLYVLTALSVQAFDESEFSTRLPSALAGTLTIPLLIILGKLLARPGTALTTALFLALSPVHLKYSQEGRHYALLLLFSLASFILLYHFVKKPSWQTALPFALATTLNLYTHYGAFIVLLAQVVWAVGYWLLVDRRRSTMLYGIASGLIVSILYLPQLPRWITALQFNTAERSFTIENSAQLSDWMSEVYLHFGLLESWRPPLMLALCVIGLLAFASRRNWTRLSLVLCGLFLPIPLILLLGVAREAFVRYVLYLLPFYLFPAGYAINQLVQKLKPTQQTPVLLGSFALIAFMSWSPLQHEYAFIQHDWRSAVSDIETNLPPDTVVVPITLNLSNGFNLTGASLPYYLPESYTLLPSHTLLPQNVEQLAQSNAPLAFVVYNWNQALPDKGQSAAYQTFVYLWQPPQSGSSTLDNLIEAYELLLPLTDEPTPLCVLEQDLSALYIVQENFIPAAQRLLTAQSRCSASLKHLQADYRATLGQAIVPGLAELANGGDHLAAALLYEFDNKHPAGLTTLTYTTITSDEPTERFTMPSNGDWGDTVRAHPPNTLTFSQTLPDEPLILHTRLALNPQSWSWGSDGVTYRITIQTADGTHELLNQTILPNDTWFPVSISLAEYVGQEVTLSLETTAGPAGDDTADWAGWETPRLMWDVQP